ncbi:hypothetical protein SteCoe_5952 [Stentor coeruleus]|uniref:B box-type domain-containing protein n=1 Tax=Stentor coeruleus TaxID=5963 RepID=A0A1R2CR43_9CILI|nr:hypothetical protein SteCoe_5952 [Stentor coeruleus]
MSEWYACSPCQICKEESKIICLCSRVFLCENCLPMHLIDEVSAKHIPKIINNFHDEDSEESSRKQVFSSIISKLQNEVLNIEEFKRISIQSINDFIEDLHKDLTIVRDEILSDLEKKCSKADEELRDAISLSKLSLNVNHPILDLFKFCKTANDVKRVKVVKQKMFHNKLDLPSLIKESMSYTININKDLKARVMPAKSPADQIEKSHNKRYSTNIINEDSPISVASSSFSQRTLSNPINDTYNQKLSKIWNFKDLPSSDGIMIEMETREKPKQIKDLGNILEYTNFSNSIFRFVAFTDNILCYNYKSRTQSLISVPGEKFFPKSSWCLTEDDKLLFSGGFDGIARNTTILYNLNTLKQEKTVNMIYPRHCHSLVSCGKYVYAFGGINGKILKDCEKFSLNHKEWKKIGTMIVGRESFGSCVHSNKIYICGGSGIESIETYTPSSNKFTLLMLRLPSPGKCCLFSYDSYIYILQKEKIHRIEVPKLSLQTLSTIENLEWWSPCEALVATDTSYISLENEFIKFSLNGTFTVEKIG